jgi:hypothetical protein
MTRCGITLLLAGLLLQAPTVCAAPLDKEGCAKLKVEEGELEQAGVRRDMSKGPHWAKVNLAPDKLEQIRRLLEVEEQLLFRCHGKPLVNLPRDPEADPGAGTDDTNEAPAKGAKSPKAPQKGGTKKTAAPPAEKKTTGSVKEEAGSKNPISASKAENEGGDPAKKIAPKAAAHKSKAKAKVEDAYRPPVSEPGSDPFAHQLAPKQ